jgi:hypothetical protein
MARRESDFIGFLGEKFKVLSGSGVTKKCISRECRDMPARSPLHGRVTGVYLGGGGGTGEGK